ncbi:MAG: SEL1-like repeat protein [Flavobacteriaceae bacterium]|jgi:TPR repeat protein|nr:SEL1-like repeat protein [Flavobacteriaceae bacterium]
MNTKKIITTCLLLLVTMVLQAQELRTFLGANGKTGMRNPSGKIVIPAEYDIIMTPKSGYIVVKKGDKYGAYDLKGKLVIPIEYESLNTTSNPNQFWAKRNGKYSYVTTGGNEVTYASENVTTKQSAPSTVVQSNPTESEVNTQLPTSVEEGEEDYLKGVTAYKQEKYADAFQYWSKAAEFEHSDAMYGMALLYDGGYHVQRNEGKALEWLKKAAAKNSVNAMFQLGDFYYKGIGGVQKNLNEAIVWYKKAAEIGDVESMSILAYFYEAGEGIAKNPNQAIAWYKKAAEKNNTISMYRLAFMYGTGAGVPQNYKEAFHWLKKAAENGDVTSMGMLSQYYEDGLGVQKNDMEAFKWGKKAAENGNIIEMTNLGNKYLVGKGTTKNTQEALKWYKQAASEGEPTAMSNLALLYIDDRYGISKNLNEAFIWAKKGAEKNDVFSMGLLGDIYFKGLGVPVNNQQALYWFEKAANGGNIDAMMLAGYIHYDNQQYDKAYLHYKKAAEKGDALAMYMVGLFIQNGWGTTASTEQAWSWVRKSANAGYKLAKERVADYDNYQRKLAAEIEKIKAEDRQADAQRVAEQRVAKSNTSSWGGFTYTAETTSRAERAKRESEARAEMQRFKQSLDMKLKSIK